MKYNRLGNTGLQVSERTSVGGWMPRADFQLTPPLEHETYDAMMRNRRFSDADERYWHDGAIIDRVHEIADSKLRDRALAERCRNGRVGGRADWTKV